MPDVFRPAALAAAALLIATAASAQPAVNHDPQAVQPGTYQVEPLHTRVQFRVSHLGFTTYWGDFSNASGALQLDPANPGASRLDVTIPVATVSTTSAKLDGELKGAEWFDAARFPNAEFHSTAVTVTGPGQARVAGNLTLHGVTRPVVLNARFNGSGTNPLDHAYTAGFEVSGQIRRSEFGIATYVPMVGDDVVLVISGAFERH